MNYEVEGDELQYRVRLGLRRKIDLVASKLCSLA